MMKLQIRCVLNETNKRVMLSSKEKNPRIFFSFLASYAQDIKEKKKGVIYIGENFLFGIIGEDKALSQEQVSEFSTILKPDKSQNKKSLLITNKVSFKVNKKKKIVTKQITQLSFVGKISQGPTREYLKMKLGFEELDL